MFNIANEVISLDFSKIDGKNVKVMSKVSTMLAKRKYVNKVATDQVYYEGDFIIAEGPLAGQDFKVKFETDYSYLLEPMGLVEIVFDEIRCRPWVNNYKQIQLSLWGKSLKSYDTPSW